MTVTYTAEVASCRKFGCFVKLLARWRGSIYKLIWMDLVLFLALYYIINFIYCNILEEESKRTFESIVYYCGSYTSLIPLSFVLGFFVNLVMSRWWEQYTTIPWPDSIAVFVSAYVHGLDEGGRLMRRTIMRYVCLCLTIVFTMISPCVKKRFPKLKHLVDAGLLLENEKQIIEAMDCAFPKYPKHWMPIVWAASIITRARKEGRIRDDFAVKTIIDELNSFRGRCGTLMYYDFISIPLVYTQVVTIAVYSFFACSLLAHQWTRKKKDTYEALDFYSPVFITLQFFFYMGWLKVAETLINPFGEDDDDFEVNWMIDRNLQVSYLIVDEMHHEHPELVRDQYWDEVYPNELPYESEVKREQPPEPSTAKYDLEDLPKIAPSMTASLTNSFANKRHLSSIHNALSRRSQRFNEAFQRFLNSSENDTAGLRSDVENSLQSVSDIESVEHITSYTYSDKGEAESQQENENIKETILQPIIETSEEPFGAVAEEEMPTIEEEDNKTETQMSYDTDTDSDLFERLRIERQQQRLQRMNEYLERHFGTNFRIITNFSAETANKYKTKTEDNTSSIDGNTEEEKTLNILDNDENLLTPTISTDYIKLDMESASSMIAIENDEKLVTPTTSMQFSADETFTKNNGNSGQQNANDDKADKSDTNQKENINKKSQVDSIRNASRTLASQSVKSLFDTQPSSSKSSQSNISFNIKSISPKGSLTSLSTQSISDIQSSISSTSKTNNLHKTKSTSPMGSARSLSTQSSFDDDWEILHQEVGEHKENKEKSEDENKK